MDYVNAGHPGPFWFRHGAQATRLESNLHMVGILPNALRIAAHSTGGRRSTVLVLRRRNGNLQRRRGSFRAGAPGSFSGCEPRDSSRVRSRTIRNCAWPAFGNRSRSADGLLVRGARISPARGGPAAGSASVPGSGRREPGCVPGNPKAGPATEKPAAINHNTFLSVKANRGGRRLRRRTLSRYPGPPAISRTFVTSSEAFVNPTRIFAFAPRPKEKQQPDS